MNIGITIKKLRNQELMTQEQLAEYLNVSVQTISRWETGINYPDILMLPQIANIFNVTTDYLLEVDNEKSKIEIDKILTRARELQHLGKNQECLIFLKNELKSHATNIELLLEIADVCNATHQTENFHEAVNISKRILSFSTVDKYRNRAINSLFWAYLSLGNKEELKKVYDQYIVNNIKTDIYTAHVLEGDELTLYLQKQMLLSVSKLWSTMMEMRKLNHYTNNEKIAILDKFNQIVPVLFEEGDYGYYGWYLQSVNDKIALLYAGMRDVDMTIKHLKLYLKYAIINDCREELIKRNSICFNKTVDQKSNQTISSSNDDIGNSCYELLKDLQDVRYHFIKEDNQFKQIIDSAQKYSVKYE